MEEIIFIDNVQFPIKWVTDAADVNEFLSKVPYQVAWDKDEEWMRAVYKLVSDKQSQKEKKGSSK